MRSKKRQRRQRRSSTTADEADSDSSFTVAHNLNSTTPARKGRKKRRTIVAASVEDEENIEDNSNDSQVSEPRTRSERKSSYRVGITITRQKKKKVGRQRKLDIYRSEDEDEDDELLSYDNHFEDEVPVSEEEHSEEDSPNEDEIEEEEEDEAICDEHLNKKRMRPAREVPAVMYMDNVEIPKLTLPPSSEDLLIKGKNLMRTLGIYEILRRFQHNLRLTPFRFEDFCVALLIDEQTYLLSEIHIQLLKALIREDDLLGTQHGPQDVRDSINIYLYLCDPMTWSEVTRVYLSSDYKKNAKILTESLASNYPFASLEQKLALLEYFCEEFLTSVSCRDVLNNEGVIKHEDNCRVCYRPGDLLCCETCPAVFHLNCLDPPLKQVPEEAWTCPICILNTVNGVTDCVGELEKLGYCSRQEPIGWDRYGRKYWFLCRRLIVEDLKDSDKVIYYSSRLQFDELLASLDAENYENDLCTALEELKDEIYRQMQITEKLTKMAKGTAYERKSYLEVINEELYIKRESKLKLKIDEAEESAKSALAEQLSELQSKLAVDENDKRNFQIDGSGVLTRLKTGTIQPKTVSTDSFKNQMYSYNNFSAVRDEETVIIQKKDEAMAADSSKSDGNDKSDDKSNDKNNDKNNDNSNDKSNDNSNDFSLTRTPRKALPPNFHAMNLFKLGMEGNYRQYQNIYSLNKFALNKAQEERDKRRHLSHKFSLTEPSELKWATYSQINTALTTTTIYGTESMVINILRQALLYLESQLSSMFMHPTWSTKRAAFARAVSLCSETSHFSLALQTLESAMKPVLLNTVWFDALGFGTGLQRSTQAERDELKRREKKDRRDGGAGFGAVTENMTAENEAAAIAAGRSSAAGVGVRLVCGKLKHQIWKQKGEEFRLSGIGGWQWSSSTRVKPDVAKSERAKVQKEELSEEKMDTDKQQKPSVIDISKALSESSPTEPKSRKYFPKVISSKPSRLDSLLKSRLDMYAFDKKQEEATKTASAAAEKAEEKENAEKTSSSVFSAPYGCYSFLCHSATSTTLSTQEQCYSPLCCHHHQASRKKEKSFSEKKLESEEVKVEQQPLSTLDDTTEHVELLEVKSVGVGIAPTVVKKIVPFKSALLPVTRFKVGKYKSMLILPMHEMRKLARNGGLLEVAGFNYACKSNNSLWPYGLTPRPNLRTMWLFRTACLSSLHATALQLRVFWAAIRWDDMLFRPSQSSSGARTITTENEVTTVEILKRRDLPPFGLRSQYLIRKIIVPIDLPSTPREVSTPSRSGLRQRKRPASPQVKGPRMEETWLNEEEIELWEIRQFAEKTIQEERKRQIELQRQKAAAELQQKKNNAAVSTTASATNKTTPVNGLKSNNIATNGSSSSLNINPKQAISSRLSSIFQNKSSSKVLASSPIINSGTITPTSVGTSNLGTTTFATIRTANGTFRVPVQQTKSGSHASQLILRPGAQIITTSTGEQSSALGGGNVLVTSNAGTPTRPGAFIVRTPNGSGGGIGTARPTIISNTSFTACNTVIVRSGGGGIPSVNPNVKQAVPFITANMPQKISTGTTVNAIMSSSSSQPLTKTTTGGTAVSTFTPTTGAINIVSASPSLTTAAALTTPTIGKGIQCVQLKTNDGRTHLLPISSLPNTPGQTFQIALKSGSSSTPVRIIATNPDFSKGQGAFHLITNGGQKVVLQPQPQPQPTSSITLPTNSTLTTNKPAIATPVMTSQSLFSATGQPLSVQVEPTDEAKTMVTPTPVTTAPAAAVVDTSLISPSKPTALSEPPPKEFELTPEVTQEIVRKALLDASLPAGTSQKLLAYQKRHRQLNKLGDQGEDSPLRGAKARKLASGKNSTPSRLMESVSPSSSSSRATTSRSGRFSRGISRYGNSDFITDFGTSSKKGQFEEEEIEDFDDGVDEVDRICASVLKGLIDKVEKKEKVARRAELREERNQKLIAANKLKLRQSHTEVTRRGIERRKAQLNINIRLRVEKDLSSQLAAVSGSKRKFEEEDETLSQVSPSKGNKKATGKAKRPKVTITPSPSPFSTVTNGLSHGDEDADEAAAIGTPKLTRMKTIKKGKTKLYCICQQPYDEDHFMIGCDVCKNWFHPSCVQMGEKELARQKKLSYTCPSCSEQQSTAEATHSKATLNGSASTSVGTPTSTAANSARKFASIRHKKKKAIKSQPPPPPPPRVEIATVSNESESATYCICQQAYDATKFYICCDRCQNWFHGRCVGITSAVANAIDDYICPQCEGNNSINYRNIKELSAEDYEALMKIHKSVQNHKHAWPFLKPVSKKEVADYYDIIEEPMDLKKIELRLKSKTYKSLAEFIYDMNKIFDNCRIYNGPTSQYYHCADTLNEYFTEKVDEFRENDR